MSKQETESVEQLRKQERKGHKNKIPHLEWLFGYGETKPSKQDAFLSKMLRKDWLKVLVSTLIYILQASPVFILPLITSDVIDVITYRPDGYQTRLMIDALMAFVLIAQNVPTTMWRSSIVNKWIRDTSADIKSGVVRKLQRLSITYHKEIEEGRIQSKFLRDITNVEIYYRTFLTAFIPNFVGAVASIVIALVKSPVIVLFFIVIVPLNILLTMAFRKPVRRQAYAFREENEKLSGKLTTAIQMLPLTKAHGLIAVEEALVNQSISSVTETGLRLDRTNAKLGSMMWAVSHGLSAGCLFFCVFLALQGIITAGEVVLFQSLFSSINSSIITLINYYPNMVTGKDAVRSLSEIICSDDLERDDGERTLSALSGAVEFEHVEYHYPGEEKKVVTDFHLSVRAGERIALVGASGSGKSTVMNLIIGLLSPTDGRICIDGVPLNDIPLQEYRRFLSVVPQNSILFSGTLRENITYGLQTYSEEEFMQALTDANVTEFLPSLPKGADTLVGEHGDKLSGGQKQRICIARALIRKPKILILDEATSALDNVSEYHVQQAIDRLVEKRTTFIVAHRLSTIRNADRIVVMDEGKIVEVGTYEQLLAKGGAFSELERLSRIREEEIAAAQAT